MQHALGVHIPQDLEHAVNQLQRALQGQTVFPVFTHVFAQRLPFQILHGKIRGAVFLKVFIDVHHSLDETKA